MANQVSHNDVKTPHQKTRFLMVVLANVQSNVNVKSRWVVLGFWQKYIFFFLFGFLRRSQKWKCDICRIFRKTDFLNILCRCKCLEILPRILLLVVWNWLKISQRMPFWKDKLIAYFIVGNFWFSSYRTRFQRILNAILIFPQSKHCLKFNVFKICNLPFPTIAREV